VAAPSDGPQASKAPRTVAGLPWRLLPRPRRDRGVPRLRFQGGAPTDLRQVLTQLREEAWHECGKWSRRASRWRGWSVALALLAAAASGAAGAASQSLTSTGRTVVAVVAFAGAALTGVAAAVGAPGQAKTASLRSDNLAAHDRWAALALVELPTKSEEEPPKCGSGVSHLARRDLRRSNSDFAAWCF